MKKFLLAVLTALTIAVMSIFVACGSKNTDSKQPAPKPPVITLSGNVVSWNKVDGADGYSVTVGQNSYETDKLSYTVVVNALGSYDITVKAYKTSGQKKVYSASSNKVTYTLAAIKLAAPVISKSGSTVSWTAVPNADKYRVYVNEVSKGEFTATSYSFAETAVGDYTVTVKAVSDSALYTVSDDSNAVTFTVGESIVPETVKITDAPYNAAADGVTNDQKAIQKAIDDMNKRGGGTVVIPADKTVVTSNIILRDNVTLKFEDGATLKQSDDEDAYVRYDNGEYSKFEPAFGMDLPGDVEWNHAWLYNYPLVLGPEGAKNIKIIGNGTFTMMDHSVCYNTMHIAPIGFFNVDGFEVSDITIDGYESYGMVVTSSFNGLIKNVTIKNPRCSCNDGINMQNNQNIRVTQCDIRSGDDSLYVAAYYDDPRGGGATWWNNNRTHVANKNIEFDHNYAVGGPNCKGFSFHFGGYMLDNPEEGEISEIYVHDNYFNLFGVWNHTPDPHAQYKPNMTLKPYQPFKTVRWENNEVGYNMGMGIPCSDMYDDTGTFKSMTKMINADFDYAKLGYWVSKPNSDEISVGYKTESGNNYGFIDKLESGDAKLYQGLWLDAESYEFSAKLRTSGATCRMFVRDLLTGTLIASREFSNTEWQTVRMEFTAPAAANYHIGIERGNATEGWANIDDGALVSVKTRNTVFINRTPENAVTGESELDLGTEFALTTFGAITGVRAYICENESGVHTVRIWNKTSGELIAGPYEWNVQSGGARWETFPLPTDVRVRNGVSYIVSVSTGEGKIYPATENGFDSITAHSKYLVVTANSGVKSATVGAMPTADSDHSNFFRDVIFVPDEQSFFDGNTGTPANGDNANGEYGLIFSADVDGYITKVSFYAYEGLSGTVTVRIWKQSGAELVAGPYDWYLTGGAAGWKSIILPTPLHINANQKYVMSIGQTIGWFGSTPYVFASPIDKGNIHTYTGSGVYSTTLGEMPTNVYNNQSYFRDITFVAAAYADALTANYIENLKTLYADGEVNEANADELKALCSFINGLLDELSPEALNAIPQADKDLITEIEENVEQYNTRANMSQSIFGNIVPDISTLMGDFADFETGVIFSADVEGYVTKVKFLSRGSLAGKTSTVRIWKTDTEQLVAGPYEWTHTVNTAGWVEYVLPTPLKIDADVKYTLSITQPAGTWYCAQFNVFGAPSQRRNLHTYIGSGVTGDWGTMPTNVFSNQSFFRDVVFTPTAYINNLAQNGIAQIKTLYGNGEVNEGNVDELIALCGFVNGLLDELSPEALNAIPQTDKDLLVEIAQNVEQYIVNARMTQSIFGNDVPDISTLMGDFASFETGVIFSADVEGYVTKVKFLSRGELAGKTSTVRIWKTDSAQLVAGPYEWTHTVNAAGWVEYTLPTPLKIDANVKYTLSITQPTGTWYCAQFNVFETPMQSGNLHTYVGSGVTGDWGTMPTNVFSNQSFFRDVVFTPAAYMGNLAQNNIAQIKTLYGDGEVNEGNVDELIALCGYINGLLGELSPEALNAIPQTDKDLITEIEENVEQYIVSARMTQSIFGYDVPDISGLAGDVGAGEYGIIFSADVDGYVTKVKFLSRGLNAGAISTVTFWQTETGEQKATYEWTHVTHSAGWAEYILPEPFEVQKDVKYTVSITQPTGMWYCAQFNVFEAPMQFGNLHTYVGSGVSGVAGSMPTSVWSNQSFFRDVVFTPADCATSLVENYIDELRTLYGAGQVTAANAAQLRNLSSSLTALIADLPDDGDVSQADKAFVASVVQAVADYDAGQ